MIFPDATRLCLKKPDVALGYLTFEAKPCDPTNSLNRLRATRQQDVLTNSKKRQSKTVVRNQHSDKFRAFSAASVASEIPSIP